MRLGFTLFLAVLIVGCSNSNKTITTSGSTEGTSASSTSAATVEGDAGYRFASPILLKADGTPIRVEQPGYACPTVADIDRDGKLDLVVGQFSEGAMQWFKNEAAAGEPPQLIAAGWLQTNGDRAIVPGVW